MEEQQQDPREGQQPDPVGAETAPVAPAFEGQGESGDRAPEDSAVNAPPPVTDPENLPQESGPSVASEEAVGSPSVSGDQPNREEGDESASEEGESGLLVGTASEQAPGVGGVGDHPAPAAMVDPESGRVRVAGEPPHAASGVAPGEEEADAETDEEAREKLNAVQEPDQIETDRPDIGTE